MSNSKKRYFWLAAIFALLAMLATAFSIAAFGAEANADENGWVVKNNAVHSYNGLTAVDGYSDFQLDHGTVTMNDTELNLSGEVTVAYRIYSTSMSSDCIYLHLVDPSELTNWQNITGTNAAVKLKLQTSVVTPDTGFDSTVASSTWNVTSGNTHYITFYIGTGEGTDTSYVIVDGVKKASTATRDAYTSGKAKLFIHAPNARRLNMASPLAPVVTSATPTSFDLTNDNETASLVINYTNVTGDVTVTAPQYSGNEYTFPAEDYTVNAQAGGKGSVTITREALKKVDWPARDAYVAVKTANGVYKVNLTVKSGEAPVFTAGTDKTFKLTSGSITQDLTVSYTYYDADTPTLSRGLAPSSSMSYERGRGAIEAGAYSFNKTGNTVTLTLKKEYLSECEEGTYWYEISTKNGTLEFPVYIAGSAKWTVRAAKGTITASADSDNYVNLALNGWENGDITKGGRAFWSDPIDVTKPIFIEYGNYTDGGWINFDFNDNPFGIEYCDEVDERSPSKIKVMDIVANQSEQQRLGASKGFYTSNVVGIGSLLNRYNHNVIEIGIGVSAQDSYIKFNGHDLTKSFAVTVKQGDFSGGKAYLSFFCATSTEFTMNKSVNSVAVYYPYDEPEYELKSADDIAVKVVNASDDLTVKYKGKTLTLGEDYDFYKGELTIYGDYLKTVPFASMLTFEISSGGTTTEMHIPAHIGTSGGDVTLSGDDDFIKYYAGADVAYKLNLGTETISDVINVEQETSLPETAYTVSGSTVTLASAYIGTLGDGINKFLIQTDSALVPVFVIKYAFVGGIAASQTLTVSGDLAGGLNVAGGGSVVMEKLYDLTEGVDSELKVTEVLGYYGSAASTGNADSYVAFTFTDIEGGNKITFRVRPNGAEDNAFIRNKLWCEITVTDSIGMSETQNTSMRLSAFDNLALKMRYEDGVLYFAVSDEPDMELDISKYGISGKNLLLQVETAAPQGDAKMAYTLKMNKSVGGGNEPPVTPAKKKKCGGNLSVAGSLIAALILLGASALIVKRKSTNQKIKETK